MEDEEFKEFIKNLVIKHIEENTFQELFSLLYDRDISKSIELVFKSSDKWSDFMQPYVENFYNELDEFWGRLDLEKYKKLISRYECLCGICRILHLMDSYGYLRGKVCEKLIKLTLNDSDLF